MYLAYELKLKPGIDQKEVPISLFTGEIEYKYAIMFRSAPVDEKTIKVQFFTIQEDTYRFRTVEMPPPLMETFRKWFEIKQVNWYEDES